MNRFVDFNGLNLTGGSPIYNEDFYTSANEIYDALNPIIQGIGKQVTTDGNFVVSGCAVTPNASDWDIASGIVSLGGELYRYDGDTAITTGTKYMIIGTPVTTSRDYKNAGTKAVLTELKAEVSGSTSGGEEIVFDPSDARPFKTLSNETGVIEGTSSNLLKTKVVEIGDWDMDATTTVTITVPNLTVNQIRSVNVVVRNDADNGTYFFSRADPATGLVDGGSPTNFLQNGTGVDIGLTRYTTGFFDNTNFDSTSYNRGWITITYEDV